MKTKSTSNIKTHKARQKERLKSNVPNTTGEKFERLSEIVALLRTDCPWDKKQTPDSLVHLTLEEVYEMIHAVDSKDEQELKKELGDILLHICFQSVLAAERNAFTIDDVLDAIAEKLIFRHPHVFGNDVARDESAVKANWEKLKMKEGRKSVLDGVPRAMPELLRAYRVQEKASGVAFDWKSADGVWEKLNEELSELRRAKTAKAREEELGDVLFTLVNLSRFLKVNPEDALRKMTEKFSRRFQAVEAAVQKSGKSWSDLTMEELDAFWETAKKREKARKKKARGVLA
ncbi:MAG: nucleoside triphosphate pyrophosphohydrolase [Chloroherpetonaceae bacterium]